MQVTKEQVDPCTIALDIRIEPEKVSQAFERAYREFGRFTNVPGFRPGKAPRMVIEQYVNQERLRERVMELVAGPAYQEALKQENIEPFSEPEVDFSDLADGAPFEFKAVVPTKPQVTLGNVEDISVDRPVYTVSEEDVDKQVDVMRGEHARVEKVEGRPVQQGDIVIAEMSEEIEGQEAAAPKRTLIRVGENIPGFDDAILGQEIGEEREFKLTYPEDHQNPDRAGREASFRVRIDTINHRVLPEATDEWVKDITGLESLAALRETVRKAQEEQVKELSDQIAASRIIEELVGKSEIQYPGVMVRDQMAEDAHHLEHELENRQVSYDQYLQSVGLTADQHRAVLERNAEARVREFLVTRELAKNEGIDASRDEIAQEFTRLAVENRWSEDDAKRIIRDEQKRQQVVNLVIRRKLRDRILQMAKVKDVPASQSAGEAQ